jgi:chemotaxis protein MotB
MRHSWKRKREQADHADDWLMTYADMITLLLCFFAIFLSVSVPKKDLPKNVQVTMPVRQPEYQPDYLEGNLPFHGREHAHEATGQDAVVVPVERKPVTLVMAPPPTLPDMPVQAAIPAPEEKQEAVKPAATLPEIVDRLKKGGPAELKEKGDRIITLIMSSGTFFESGSSSLSASGKAILREVAANLKAEKFRDYQITVEGHTDDAPISTAQFPSNWELSTARAAAVVHYFLEQGISAQKLRAAGYADTFPIAPNRDVHGKAIPEHQARNRRVVIKLEKIVRDE